MAATMAKMQQSRTLNNATCGRRWKLPLAEIHGKIKKVEYRIQPGTERKGLHIDVETAPRQYTVVHVYPERLTAQCPTMFHFSPGDVVTVVGSAFFAGIGGSQRNICAATVTQRSDRLELRDTVTGALEQQVCCREICRKQCTGLPFVCSRMCMGNCQNMITAVSQPVDAVSTSDPR
ncbi:MAG: hypothetical protein ACL93V_00885 [Candidatus Electrothrix sp. YB6]